MNKLLVKALLKHSRSILEYHIPAVCVPSAVHLGLACSSMHAITSNVSTLAFCAV